MPLIADDDGTIGLYYLEAERHVVAYLRRKGFEVVWLNERGEAGLDHDVVAFVGYSAVRIDVKRVPTTRARFVNGGAHRPTRFGVVVAVGPDVDPTIIGVVLSDQWHHGKPEPDKRACWHVSRDEMLGVAEFEVMLSEETRDGIEDTANDGTVRAGTDQRPRSDDPGSDDVEPDDRPTRSGTDWDDLPNVRPPAVVLRR
jgi:hypothetical protein